MQNLYRLYDGAGLSAAAPLFCKAIGVNGIVHLTSDGQLDHYEPLDKIVGVMAPVTSKSAIRTSGKAPHALYDRVSYLSCPEYLKRLAAWRAAYPSPKLDAIYNFSASGGPEALGLDGRTTIAYKLGDAPLADEDASLLQSYGRFVADNLGHADGIDYITGEAAALTSAYPRDIVRPGDGNKPICNDDNDLGRFGDATAATLGIVQLEKAACALRYVIAQYGITWHGLTVYSYTDNDTPLPVLLSDISLDDVDMVADDEQVHIGVMTSPVRAHLAWVYKRTITGRQYKDSLHDWLGHGMPMLADLLTLVGPSVDSCTAMLNAMLGLRPLPVKYARQALTGIAAAVQTQQWRVVKAAVYAMQALATYLDQPMSGRAIIAGERAGRWANANKSLARIITDYRHCRDYGFWRGLNAVMTASKCKIV